MRLQRALLAPLTAAALAASPNAASAQACPTATFSDYIAGAVGPCTIDAVTFSGFDGFYAAAGTSVALGPSSAMGILVTPTSGVMGTSSYVGFQLTRPGAPVFQELSGVGSVAPLPVGSTNLLLGASAAVGGGNTFRRLIIASGTVESMVTGLFNLGSARIRAIDVGGATAEAVAFAPFPNGGSASASCTPATCDVAFDGGAFEIRSWVDGQLQTGGSVAGTVSSYEVRFTYGPAAVVPEPGAVALVGTGLLLLGGATRRRRR